MSLTFSKINKKKKNRKQISNHHFILVLISLSNRNFKSSFRKYNLGNSNEFWMNANDEETV